MRAVIYDRIGERPTLIELPVPACPVDGAVVRVEATGVCRSDWHAWRGHDPVPLPIVPGHEFAGVVAEVGATVTRFAPGDRVTAPFVNGCGRCEWCLRGEAQVCPEQTQPGFTRDGSFAEYVVVTAADTNLVALPDSVGMDAAAALGCRFATAFRALTAGAHVAPDDEVAVFGCGGVGLSAVMIAAALGARVTAADVSDAALARARELGASHTIRVDERNVSAPRVAPSAPGTNTGTATISLEQGVIAATNGGAHVTVDALGSAGTAASAVRSLRRRGTHVQVGLMLGENATAPLPWDRVIAWELTVAGSHGMSARDYQGMLDLIVHGRLDPARLIGSTTDLAGAIDALTAMDSPRPASAGIVIARP
ncbi:zinc-dependent alcohol dehydrogenase family protein [Humibacter ginsenosidimutans]|uniref:Zinc-dependent alcohol dehydrogenase family protein n=1 Tax=Humibacter ginsenosidimutans TaxID=2599293 RepID=A0A5B8M9C2_9MICO|nr:zinc-dependent alcohol dehydrogenase family protein [Humibacter ginsenosidimutans]QDZ16879.1 zinc-dependent alcohol dehydrogenase family protein [Humibacter ginsenosidimutans]